SLKFTDSVLLDIQHQVSPLKRDLRSAPTSIQHLPGKSNDLR
ncbi:hypothetical protein D1BOALGB6SA_761, partial [Olavius sp. associated proteobacterium Delta 1]